MRSIAHHRTSLISRLGNIPQKPQNYGTWTLRGQDLQNIVTLHNSSILGQKDGKSKERGKTEVRDRGSGVGSENQRIKVEAEVGG